MQAQLSESSIKLPDSINGWYQPDELILHTPETLYDYINGGAELYISYGMKEVISQLYIHQDLEIRVEIFDMGSSKNAFGVFSHTRTEDENEYGQGSQYFTGALIFWKGKYFISIVSNDENELIKRTIHKMAFALDEKIQETGLLPEIIRFLPEHGLQKDGYFYFHHYIWLNAFYYIANDNFLKINAQSDGILAKYGSDDDRHYLLVVQYSSEEEAFQAGKQFFAKYLTDQANDGVEKLEDGSWTGGKVEGSFFIAVFNGPSFKIVNKLLNSVISKIQIEN